MMKSDEERLTVKEFKEKVDYYQDQIGCDGTVFGSHTFPSSINFILKKKNGNHQELRLVEDEPYMLMGCGCWGGIYFYFEEGGEEY